MHFTDIVSFKQGRCMSVSDFFGPSKYCVENLKRDFFFSNNGIDIDTMVVKHIYCFLWKNVACLPTAAPTSLNPFWVAMLAWATHKLRNLHNFSSAKCSGVIICFIFYLPFHLGYK